jgi:hypothetical protein
VKSRATPRFWASYRDLPTEIKESARKAYRLFREDPQHPSLQFKKVHVLEPLYSVRVTLGYRALGLLDGDGIAWFWIGTHAAYDRLLDNL